ncbi:MULTISPECIES: class II fructose-bisphosphate aldolase [Streptomyces]|jgi:fructose-bisphosphate aldolase class II|uniref:Class II fructose-bisphosphate aldolase n=1 Tax=Streptomyces edwardsiae TaxID=3075527 RepID=A0ABU2PN23_9ACTN|nr:class II fructose-bisphosphate aldolase [Streptomyces sp. DSM 41636]MDT0393568.1 class II fructose-bisphosphate aldolase [Streptomyces sp. DSM 41636]
MSLVPTRELVEKAAAAGRAVAAFNVITLEHAEAIAAGAEAAERSVILQISENAVRFHGGRVGPIARAAAEVGTACAVDVALHLDHVTDIRLLHTAADAGFSSAMFDAGALPYAENLAATRAAVRWAHGAGLWLEAELGYVGGKPDAPASAHAAGVRTDPREAARYVADTGVDALAVAVGSSHAMTERSASLDHALIERLRDAVRVPLVLHGSSGVGDDELRRAVRAGIVKVNVGTALNIAFTRAVRETLTARPDLTDPRPYVGRGRETMAETVRTLLGVVSG